MCASQGEPARETRRLRNLLERIRVERLGPSGLDLLDEVAGDSRFRMVLDNRLPIGPIQHTVDPVFLRIE
jgi:hypothetical protein